MEEGLASNIIEALEQPLELAIEIMEMRSFAQARQMIKDARDEKQNMPDHPMIDTVFMIVKEIADDARRARANKRLEGSP